MPAPTPPARRRPAARGGARPIGPACEAGQPGERAEAPAAAPVRRLLAASALIALLTVAVAAIVRLGASGEAGESFLWLFGLQELPGGLLALLACGLAASAAAGPLGRAAGGVARAIAGRPRLAALLAAAVLALLARTVYRGYPMTADEYLPVFQARIFAGGEVTARWPLDLLPAMLPRDIAPIFYLVGPRGDVASAYWPGLALLLAPFAAIGMEWLLNPLLAAGSLALLVALARRLYPRAPDAPGWVALFALASPAFGINAISFYSMNAHLFANLLFAWLLAERGRGRAAAAGVVGSLALVLHNPVPHTLFALPWLAWIAARRERRPQLLPLIAGYLPLVVTAGVGWLALRLQAAGGPLPPLAIRSPFAFPDHERVWIALLEMLRACSWAVPGLPILAAWGCVLLRRHGERPARELGALLSASLLSVLAGYLFVVLDQGYGWGYRHLHYAWGALPLLAAAPLVWATARGELRAAAGALALVTLVAGNGLRSWEVDRLVRAERAGLAPMPRAADAVCFVTARYNLHQIRNDPFLRGPLVLVSQGARDAEVLRRRFPGARRLETPRGIACWSVEERALRGLRGSTRR